MEKQKMEEIKKLPLKEILHERFGMEFNSSGLTCCPFHDDSKPSFSVFKEKNGYWRWNCFGCRNGGDYIDFIKVKLNMNFNDSVEDIISAHNLQFKTEDFSRKNSLKKEEVFTYINEEGNPVYRKIKFVNKKYSIERYENGKWIPGLNNTKPILYNLPQLIESKDVYLLEGEKDCETINSLGFEATTAGSVNSWKKEFAQYFKDKLVYICLDVGNEEIANKIASDLLGIAKGIKILSLPGLKEKEQDITDWFETMGDASDEDKAIEIMGVVFNTPFIKAKQNILEPSAENIPQFMAKEIPEREVFIQNWIEREGLTILGGVQKVGKSIITLNLAICLTLGSDFLGFKTPQPRSVLLYQQEIAAPAMQERIKKMTKNISIDALKNLRIKNTTGNLIKITSENDRKELFKVIESCKPDLVVFDPLSTFHDRKENDASGMSKVMDYFVEIKNKFKIAVLLVHHHGKPQLAQREGGHQLRGSSVIGDRADAIINLNRLPDRINRDRLDYPHDHYADIKFVLRNDANPGDLVVERNPDTLWYKAVGPSKYFNRKLPPKLILSIVEQNGGTMLQTKLEPILLEMASRAVALKAIREAEELGYIESEPLPGRGNPKLLKVKK